MAKVILVPINRLSLDDMRKVFKKIKKDARESKAASTVEGEQKNGSNPTA